MTNSGGKKFSGASVSIETAVASVYTFAIIYSRHALLQRKYIIKKRYIYLYISYIYIFEKGKNPFPRPIRANKQ